MSERNISICSWRDLHQFGINALTGEACAYSLRVLCDVTEEGRELLSDWLGVPGLSLPPAWNSHVGTTPATGCIMLDRGALRELGLFILFHEGALAVLEQNDQSLNGIFSQALLSQYEAAGYSLRRNPRASQPGNSRNMHAMTGRVV